MNKKLTSSANKCANCGDDLLFNPDFGNLICPSCKSKKEIVSKLDLNKHSINKQDNLSSHKNTDWTNETKSLQCKNCGAVSLLKNYQTSATCPYCETPLVASMQKLEGVKPDSIIPFKFGKESAVEKFKQSLQKKFFAPKKFKNSIKADEVHAYYFPSFIFDSDCSTIYDGELYEEYEVKDSDGDTETKKRYFNIAGTKNTTHSNIAIEASTHLSQFQLNSIKPYNFAEARVYSDDFIYGFSLENYSNSVNETHQQAKTIIKQEIKNSILHDYDYDGVNYLNMNTTYSNEKYSYCVLPLYKINYNYKNKNYTNIMNGQTGKLSGNYPKSGGKIALISILISLVFIIPILIFVLSFIGII